MTSYGNTKSIFDTMYGSRDLLDIIFFVHTKAATPTITALTKILAQGLYL
jgi:hypothetical protein